MKQQWLANPGC